MKYYLTIAVLFTTFLTFSQFSDDFSDGDFTTGVTWSGSDANFEVDADFQLHLNAPSESDTSFLSTPSTEINDVTWDTWINMDFNPSSGNNARIYLVSDQADLKGSLNGYFVLIGNTDDEVSLYRQDGLSITKIIDGTDGTVDADDVFVRIQVTRDASGNWELFQDNTGGYAYVSEGTVNDNTYTSTDYFGVFCKYTSSRSDLFYFDDLGVPYEDAVIPEVLGVTAISDTEVDVTFSEPVDPVSAVLNTNYSVNEGVGNPISAIVDGVDPALVHLTFGSTFVNGTAYELTVENVEDLSGNSIESPTVIEFLYFVAEVAEENDVIITEVLADPNPVIGLPEVEFFEIYNRSEKFFDLNNWTVNDNTNTGTFGTYVLAPDSYVVVCAPENTALFGISNIIGVDGLPTLTNSEDDLVLKDETGIILDSIRYSVDWYNDGEKDGGGWTLERKHLDAPCSDFNNWGASVDPAGGTPGLQNSIWTDEDDVEAPFIFNVEVPSPDQIVVTFSESIDQDIEPTFSAEPSLLVISGEFSDDNQYTWNISPLEEGIFYDITIENIADCWGNTSLLLFEVGLPLPAESGDLIVNEVLFNPVTGGSDYVEVVNISDKIIDLNELYLGSWDDDSLAPGNFEPIGEDQYLLFPGEYIVFTEDSMDVIDNISIYGEGRFLETDLPTYPNDSGTVYLLNSDSTILDFFQYDEDLHFDLLNSEDGKALERITFGGGMNNPENWHTASENVDWGTPGYLNSQFIIPNVVGEVSLDPQLFSPDNDGYNDILTINFDLTDADNVVDVIVYDNQGRTIRQLQDNYFIGNTGNITWDGINDDGNKAAIGTYIVLVSVQSSSGDQQLFKLVTVLGGQL